MKNIPLYFVRGGTSSGVVIFNEDLPHDKLEVENILRKIFGTPLTDSQKTDPYQIEGIGKGKSTSNKALILDLDRDTKIVRSTFVQLENGSSSVSWMVNCGNMTSSIPLVLDDKGVLSEMEIDGRLHIYNENTKKELYCKTYRDGDYFKSCFIPGVEHEYPKVDVSFPNPEGGITGDLFPSGDKINIIDGIEVTCIDAVTPMVIIHSLSLGLSGGESKRELMDNKNLINKINEIKVLAGLLMRLKNKKGDLMTKEEISLSITTPKIALISKQEGDADVSMIYFTPNEIHNSIAVSGGCCLAYACKTKGTVASNLFSSGDLVRIKHFSGVSSFGIRNGGDGAEIYTERNAQIYIKGSAVIY